MMAKLGFGNPLAVAAGRAALAVLAEDDFAAYRRLEEVSARLQAGLEAQAAERGVPLAVQRVGSMLGLFFREGPAEDLAAVEASDRDLYARVFHGLLSRGVHLPPSPFETLFVSLAHGEAEIDRTVEAFGQALEAALGEAI